MFFPDPVLNWNQIDVFVPGRLVILYREMSMPGCHSRVTRHRPTSADILNIPDTREISSNDGHLQPPSDPQINCTTGWTLLTWQINVWEHWFHSCGHLRGFKRLEFLLKWVKWHSRWFPGFCALSVCQSLLSLRHWYLDMRIFHPTLPNYTHCIAIAMLADLIFFFWDSFLKPKLIINTKLM